MFADKISNVKNVVLVEPRMSSYIIPRQIRIGQCLFYNFTNALNKNNDFLYFLNCMK